MAPIRFVITVMTVWKFNKLSIQRKRDILLTVTSRLKDNFFNVTKKNIDTQIEFDRQENGGWAYQQIQRLIRSYKNNVNLGGSAVS